LALESLPAGDRGCDSATADRPTASALAHAKPDRRARGRDRSSDYTRHRDRNAVPDCSIRSFSRHAWQIEIARQPLQLAKVSPRPASVSFAFARHATRSSIAEFGVALDDDHVSAPVAILKMSEP
jgi:hypothetical protein